MNTQLFKIQRSKYKKIYIGSDFHYNHQRDFIWKPRGFSTYHDHDKKIESDCGKIDPDDLLIYLGDGTLNSTDEQTKSLFNRIRCPKYYIFGNHESVVDRLYRTALKQVFYNNFPNEESVNFKELSVYPLSTDFKGFNKVGIHASAAFPNTVFFGYDATFAIAGDVFYCQHMAPLIWDKMKYDNQFCVTGHSHGNCKSINLDAKEGRILDVGVDNALRYNGTCFFTTEEIHDIMQKKSIKIHDHHGDSND